MTNESYSNVTQESWPEITTATYIVKNSSITFVLNESLNYIVYGSEEEQPITIYVIALASMGIILGQGTIIITILKTESLHETHFYIILIHCIGDIILLFSASTVCLTQLMTRTINELDC